MESYKIINKKLTELFGKDTELNLPMYRIIQNTRSLTEKRQGTYDVWSGPIFIRQETGMLEVPKYNYVPEDYWILEKLYYTTNPELTTKYTYEICWMFQFKDGSYQMPTLKACLFLINMIHGDKPKGMSELEISERDKQQFFDMLGGKAGVMDNTTVSGEAISMHGLDAPSLMKG